MRCCSCRALLKSQVGVVEQVGSKPGLLDTVRNLLDRACPLLMDAGCIEILVTKVHVLLAMLQYAWIWGRAGDCHRKNGDRSLRCL